MEEIDYTLLRKRIAIESAVLKAHNEHEAYLASLEVTEDEPVSKEGVRNRMIAVDGEGEKILGNISSDPVYDAKALEALGFERILAAGLIAERDRLRSEALKLTAVKHVDIIEGKK
jgi:hypothetical protein